MYSHIVSHVVTTWGYYAVFAVTAAEGFGLFFVPGETVFVAAAIVAAGAASNNGHHLFIGWVLVAAFCGAILGDNFSYLIGHLFGFRLIRRYGHYIRINEKRIKFIQYLYLRYGKPIVFIGRFVMFLRAWESFLAGANGMPWRRFAPVNAAAILVWVLVWGLGPMGWAQHRVLCWNGAASASSCLSASFLSQAGSISGAMKMTWRQDPRRRCPARCAPDRWEARARKQPRKHRWRLEIRAGLIGPANFRTIAHTHRP